MNTANIVQKLWNYCNVLRDDGMSYGDYVVQITYLLFLKMADERSRPPYSQKSPVPAGYDWAKIFPTLALPRKRGRESFCGDALFDHYRHTLEELGKQKSLLGLIFTKSQNKFQDPAKLRRLIVDLIDKETWVSMSADVKGDAYEGLLEKNAQDTSPARANTLPRARGHGRGHHTGRNHDGLQQRHDDDDQHRGGYPGFDSFLQSVSRS